MPILTWFLKIVWSWTSVLFTFHVWRCENWYILIKILINSRELQDDRERIKYWRKHRNILETNVVQLCACNLELTKSYHNLAKTTKRYVYDVKMLGVCGSTHTIHALRNGHIKQCNNVRNINNKLNWHLKSRRLNESISENY